ncbi:hypothetical protein HOU03_gp101 [Caulobacter phage CcrSC]|uniref:Uncharacterized protein n=1 Tax=Caulobacter phage CcrSC TaxID=2283272 RepID=A0A385ED25_9CAUD|nr:hypothetical protein HOU03_gp101 [Caulobacter phage CcrSC]AXQ69683.1 hypothetical protein CcrSC_gp101 [Caulobacter phage CcrSC]
MVDIPTAASVLALVPGVSFETFSRTIVNQITTAANSGRREITIMNNAVKGNLVADYVKGATTGDDIVAKLMRELAAKGYKITRHSEDYRDQRDYSPAYISISW